MLLQGDVIRQLKTLPENSIDLTVTSPPYNLNKEYRNAASDDLKYQDYLAFSRKWLKGVLRASKPDGRLCLNVPLDTHKKNPVYSDFIQICLKLGWRYQTTIVWNEQNVSRRTAWGSFMMASAPFVTAPVEMIVVFYKEVWKKQARKTSTIARQDFIDWTNGVWTFSGEKKRNVGGHPAAFPEELPKRCIQLYSFKEDTILDPFMGSGTTCVVAKKLGRHYVGIELSEEYMKFAKERIENAS